jgi:hypothetical protein
MYCLFQAFMRPLVLWFGSPTLLEKDRMTSRFNQFNIQSSIFTPIQIWIPITQRITPKIKSENRIQFLFAISIRQPQSMHMHTALWFCPSFNEVVLIWRFYLRVSSTSPTASLFCSIKQQPVLIRRPCARSGARIKKRYVFCFDIPRCRQTEVRFRFSNCRIETTICLLCCSYNPETVLPSSLNAFSWSYSIKFTNIYLSSFL